jgi:hypothetical protein
LTRAGQVTRSTRRSPGRARRSGGSRVPRSDT